MKRILTIIAVAALVSACGVNPNDAKRVLESNGVRNPVIGGYAWFGCSDNDDFASTFTGYGADGKPVSGAICGGWFKSYTVRFN